MTKPKTEKCQKGMDPDTTLGGQDKANGPGLLLVTDHMATWGLRLDRIVTGIFRLPQFPAQTQDTLVRRRVHKSMHGILPTTGFTTPREDQISIVKEAFLPHTVEVLCSHSGDKHDRGKKRTF